MSIHHLTLRLLVGLGLLAAGAFSLGQALPPADVMAFTVVPFVGAEAGHRLRLADVSRGLEINLLPAERRLGGLARSPDGRYLTFVGQDEGADIFLYDLHDLVKRRVTTTRQVERSFAWSPDGARLAYVADNPRGGQHLRLYELATTADRELTSHVGRLSHLTWTADGARLAYVVDDAAAGQVYWYDIATGGLPTRVTDLEFAYTCPHWSADGAHLSFFEPLDRRVWRLHTVTIGGGPALTRDVNRHLGRQCPDWLPDGRRIAMHLPPRDFQGISLALVDSETGARQPLVFGLVEPVLVAFSPDTTRAAYTRRVGPNQLPIQFIGLDGSPLGSYRIRPGDQLSAMVWLPPWRGAR